MKLKKWVVIFGICYITSNLSFFALCGMILMIEPTSGYDPIMVMAFAFVKLWVLIIFIILAWKVKDNWDWIESKIAKEAPPPNKEDSK